MPRTRTGFPASAAKRWWQLCRDRFRETSILAGAFLLWKMGADL